MDAMSDDNLSVQELSNEGFEDVNHDGMFELNPNTHPGYYDIAPPHYSSGFMTTHVEPYLLQLQQPPPPTQFFANEFVGSEPDESVDPMYYPSGGNVLQYYIDPPLADANDDDNENNVENYQQNEGSFDDSMIEIVYEDQPPIPMYDGTMQPQMGLYDQASMNMDYMQQPQTYYLVPINQQQDMAEFPNYVGEEVVMNLPEMGLNIPEQQQQWEEAPIVEPEIPEASPPRKKGRKKKPGATTRKPRQFETPMIGARKRTRRAPFNEDAALPVELPAGFDQVLQRAAFGPSDNDAIEVDPEMDIEPPVLEREVNIDTESFNKEQSSDSDAREDDNVPPRRREIRRCETKVMLKAVDGHLFNKYFEEADNRDFARRFKTLRCEYGFSQADVGIALGLRYGSDFSQTTISRFEGLVLSHTNMCKLRPLIEQWLGDIQSALDNGIPVEQLGRACLVGDFWPSKKPQQSVTAALVPPLRKRRKRTCLDASQRLALESYFQVNVRPDNVQTNEISRTLELDFEVVRVWFCNRRQKEHKIAAKAKARLARESDSLDMDVLTPSPTPSPQSDALDDEDEAMDDEPLEEESIEESCEVPDQE